MLVAIFISNLINRFIPSVSTPIIQIALGVLIILLPFHFQLKLNHELFFVLFIAPLLFNDARLADRKYLWKLRKPILLMAIGLVFLTVVVIGYFINFLIPSIPVAAAFALAAALAPTDAVAVSSLSEKIKFPHVTTHVLEGEALINDASGLVSFQFAIAAMVMGTFSLVQAGVSFVLISAGGVLVGLILTALKYHLVKIIRALGMENVTLHMLIEVLTPFLIYLIAEDVGVSGILAVVAAGVAHSFGLKQVTPETARLSITSKSTWSVIVFVLNGLVFLILGTQLPDIIRTIWYNEYVSNVEIVSYILLITFALIVLRFLWVLLTVEKSYFTDKNQDTHKIASALLIGLSGVRGAVTLAGTLSIPFVLANGNAFPQRDLIIFIASGVILTSLILANFLLPFLAKKEIVLLDAGAISENEASIQILKNVVEELSNQITEENKIAIEKVCRDYLRRMQSLEHKEKSKGKKNIEEGNLRLQVFEWEKENINHLMESNAVNLLVASRYLYILNRVILKHNKGRKGMAGLLIGDAGRIFHLLGSLLKRKKSDHHRENENELKKIRISNINYVIEKLNQLIKKGHPNSELMKTYVKKYKRAVEMINAERPDFKAMNEIQPQIMEFSLVGFQLERDNIQMMFENGTISREQAKELRKDISLMESELKDEEI